MRRRLNLALALVVMCLGVSSCSPPGAPYAKHVVLVVFDTLRADRMSVYGHDRPTTPFLEEFVNKAVLYADVRATAPWTVPSHASIFTGLLPSEHRAQWGRIFLDDDVVTLAEMLREAGFCTMGRSANAFLTNKKVGLTQGFTDFATVWGHPTKKIRLPAKQSPILIEQAGELLDRSIAEGCRTFLFINVMDTHLPYNVKRFGADFGLEGKPPIVNAAQKWKVSAGERTLSPQELSQHRAAYDAAVREVDEVARGIVGMLAERGILDETLLVFTADHGDGLGFHQEMGHSISVWDEQLRVPLVVRFPQGFRGGEVVKRRVSLLGITPAILDWLGLERPKQLVGKPGLDQRRDAPVVAEARGYFHEALRGQNVNMADRYPELVQQVDHRHVVYCGDHKFIRSPDATTWLFDIRADPNEQNDLAETMLPAMSDCETVYGHLYTAGAYTPFDNAKAGEAEWQIDVELLRSLGYVQ